MESKIVDKVSDVLNLCEYPIKLRVHFSYEFICDQELDLEQFKENCTKKNIVYFEYPHMTDRSVSFIFNKKIYNDQIDTKTPWVRMATEDIIGDSSDGTELKYSLDLCRYIDRGLIAKDKRYHFLLK